MKTEMPSSTTDDVAERLSGMIESVTEKLQSVAAKTDGEHSSSRPPSPPDSGTTTPRVSIGLHPERLRQLIPPLNYGTVDEYAIYRSSYPQDRNMDFIKSLGIRSVLTLVDTEPSIGYMQWMAEYNIKQVKIEIATNKDGVVKTTSDSLCEALLFLMDGANYPLYVHCNQGKHRTGCVVACLRKIQKVPMDQILREYVAYADKKARDGDIELIKSFDPNTVYKYAKQNGYFSGPARRIDRVDSIANMEALVEALASRAFEYDSEMGMDFQDVGGSATTSATSSDYNAEVEKDERESNGVGQLELMDMDSDYWKEKLHAAT